MLLPDRNHDARTAMLARERVLARMSPRELEFLLLTCCIEEHGYKAIAGKMDVGEDTVDGYRKQLCKKFGIATKTGLVLFAYEWGIVRPGRPGIRAS